MANDYFQFKQFRINQDQCSMKVGTDGVLLGAWVNIVQSNTILDIGAGTGLISLMIAQRNPDSSIDAVEIDHHAYLQASHNVNESIFKEQIQLIHVDFNQYSTNKKYDFIVSNPPFFNHGTRSPNASRNIARHSIKLDYASLISKATGMLQPNGKLALIVPSDQLDEIVNIGSSVGLYCNRKCLVYPNSNKPCKRVLLEFSGLPTETHEEKLILETQRHQYSPEAQRMFQDFYLKL